MLKKLIVKGSKCQDSQITTTADYETLLAAVANDETLFAALASDEAIVDSTPNFIHEEEDGSLIISAQYQ
jgi:hypothetical protein